MTDTTRRGFLARLGGLASVPVLTAFVDRDGLAVPDRALEVAREMPSPMVISSVTAPPPDWAPGQLIQAPQGQLLIWVDGVAWRVAAWRA